MYSIYTILEWSQSSRYSKDDIVSRNGKFYYASKDIQENTQFSEDIFFGYLTQAVEKPYFFWEPSFGSSIVNNMNTSSVQFDGGVEKSFIDGINFDSLEIDINFQNLSENSAKAITHFLNARKGSESFYFKPPFPYNKMKIFLCPEWQHSMKFINNHTVRAKFIEKFN